MCIDRCSFSYNVRNMTVSLHQYYCVAKKWFSKSGLFWSYHNLGCERPISKKWLHLVASYLVVLQYGVVRAVIYFGSKLSTFRKKKCGLYNYNY